MLKVRCSKGCGDDLEVGPEEFSAALAKGELNFSHDLCPKVEDLHHEYMMEVKFYRIPKSGDVEHGLMLRSNTRHRALTFMDAFPLLVEAMNETVVKLAAVAPTAEEGYEEPPLPEDEEEMERPGYDEGKW